MCGSLIVVVAFSNLWWVSREIQPIMDEDIYELTPKTLNAPFQRMQPWQIYSTNANAGQFFYGSRDRSLYQWGKDAAINDILQGFGLFQAHQVGLRLSRHMSLYSEIPDPQLPEPARERLLDIMNIRYVVFGERFDKVFFENGSKEVQVMDRPSALPKAFVVDGWRSAPDFISAARTMLSPSFDPHREVVLEPLDGTPMPSCFHDPSQNGSAGTVRSLDYKWKSVSLKVDAARDSLLVLTDTWFPGWVATVNGKSVPIYLANANFRAVPLVPGLNEVRMEYRPRAFFIGLAITLTAVFVLLALGALQLVRLWLAPKPVEQPPILRKRKR